MADPITGGLVVGGLMAGGSMIQASQGNANARRGARSALAAARANEYLNMQAATSKRSQLAAQFGQYTRAATASASVRNALTSASTEAMERASLASALTDQSNISAEERATQVNIWTGAQNTINQYQSQMQSPLLAGMMGGISGFASGASMSSAFKK